MCSMTVRQRRLRHSPQTRRRSAQRRALRMSQHGSSRGSTPCGRNLFLEEATLSPSPSDTRSIGYTRTFLSLLACITNDGCCVVEIKRSRLRRRHLPRVSVLSDWNQSTACSGPHLSLRRQHRLEALRRRTLTCNRTETVSTCLQGSFA